MSYDFLQHRALEELECNSVWWIHTLSPIALEQNTIFIANLHNGRNRVLNIRCKLKTFWWIGVLWLCLYICIEVAIILQGFCLQCGCQCVYASSKPVVLHVRWYERLCPLRTYRYGNVMVVCTWTISCLPRCLHVFQTKAHMVGVTMPTVFLENLIADQNLLECGLNFMHDITDMCENCFQNKSLCV